MLFQPENIKSNPRKYFKSQAFFILHRSMFLTLDLAARIAILWFVFICFRGPNDHTSYLNLRGYFKKFDSYIRYMLGPSEYDVAPPFTLDLNEIPSDGPSLVGGKAFNLSAIGNTLHLPIPEGFAIATNAYHYFIEFNDLRKKINENLSELDIDCIECLDAVSHQLMEMIVNAQVPPEIEEKILAAYRKLMETAGPDVKVAMRSSAMGEDTESSFAGQ